MARNSTKDEKLLKEIREDFDYCVEAWRDTYDEGDTDIKYLSGDPWDPREKRAREGKRPCLAFDELGQYCNQLINDVRQNKRAIKVVPRGNGATDKTATLRGNIIRGVEYKSKAQNAYCTAFENVVNRSIGFARVSKRRVAPDSFDQELCIAPIANVRTVYIDPDCKERDCSDMQRAFVLERFRHEKFKKRWPKAQITDFSAEMISQAPRWLGERDVQVAECWRVEKTSRTLLLLDMGHGVKVYEDELEDAEIDGTECHLPKDCAVEVEEGEPAFTIPKGTYEILNSLDVEDPHVIQYISNGVEILEENPWDGKYIPIGVCLGKELYVDDGGGTKRVLHSLIRMARNPYMAYCYARTAEMETIAMIPKAPRTGYVGQFDGQEQEWQKSLHEPVAFLQVHAKTEETGEAILPIPERGNYEPAIQSLEMVAESYKRSIQSAMGMFNTSVGKHDTNAQSGKAIEKLDQQSNEGSFHFIDNFDMFLEHMGRICDDLIDSTYDTARDVGTREANDEHKVVHVNEPVTDPKSGEVTHHSTQQGDHDVSIQVGPSSDSQRDAASDFADQLAQNPAVFPLIGDLIVKMKGLGPIGDEIAERLIPPSVAAKQAGQQQLPPQVAQQMAGDKQTIQVLQAKLTQLQQELEAKVPENHTKIQIAKMVETTKRLEIQAQIRIAELTAGVKAAATRLEHEVSAIQHSLDLEDSQADRDHEATQADMDRQHQVSQAESAQAAQQAQAEQAAQQQQPSGGQ